MKKLVFIAAIMFFFVAHAQAAILVMSTNGTYTTESTLSAAATDAFAAGKTVVVTSALSAVMSNISSATVHTWPTDRALKIVKGGSLGNTTKIDFTGTNVEFPENQQVFTGTGSITGLKTARPEWWGVSGTNDDVAIKAALAQKGVVILVPNKTYTMSAGITVDVRYNRIEGNNAILDFGSLSSGSAVSFTSTQVSNQPYYQNQRVLENLQVKGKAFGGGFVNAIGINFDGTGLTYPLAVSLFSTSNVNVYGFATGVQFGDHAYGITNNNMTVHDCIVAVGTVSGAYTDGGENLSFIGGFIFNNGTNISMTASTADMSFVGTSIDYASSLQIQQTTGTLSFTNCHLESGAVPLLSQLGAGILSFNNCFLIQASSSGATPYLTVGGYVTMVGGKIVGNAGTTTLISIPTGTRYTQIGTTMQYGGVNKWGFGGGFYFIFEANSGNLISNVAMQTSIPIATTGEFWAGGVAGTNTITVSALNTWTSLGYNAAIGLWVFRDATAGGGAVFLADTAVAPVSISNSITGLQMRWNAGTGQFEIQLTAGAVPRNFYLGVLRTQ